jgi:hypothetical protein
MEENQLMKKRMKQNVYIHHTMEGLATNAA